MTTLDHADAVRVGEELPLDALADYLAIHAPELRGSLTVAQFPRGYSNLTYLIQVGEQELVLRRPPFGANIAGGHDMGREARVLAGLGRVYDRVPRLVAYCDDLAVIGAPFYVMQRVQGVVLRAADLPTLDISPGVMAGLAVATVDNLAAIHRLDYDAAGLASLG
jgi:aminoglycoside phosphotransferase (APT) family kinase protein